MNVKKVLSGIDAKFIKKSAANVDDEDIQKVIDSASDIKQKIVNSAPLKRFVKNHLKQVFSMFSFNGVEVLMKNYLTITVYNLS